MANCTLTVAEAIAQLMMQYESSGVPVEVTGDDEEFLVRMAESGRFRVTISNGGQSVRIEDEVES